MSNTFEDQIARAKDTIEDLKYKEFIAKINGGNGYKYRHRIKSYQALIKVLTSRAKEERNVEHKTNTSTQTTGESES